MNIFIHNRHCRSFDLPQVKQNWILSMATFEYELSNEFSNN